jgi:maltose alpha-D-glucosyltransferase/alpha-amylase
VLCVNNLSGSPQGTRLHLPGLRGSTLDDCFGGDGFLPVGDSESLDVTLGSRGFYWLRVGEPAARPTETGTGTSTHTGGGGRR